MKTHETRSPAPGAPTPCQICGLTYTRDDIDRHRRAPLHATRMCTIFMQRAGFADLTPQEPGSFNHVLKRAGIHPRFRHTDTSSGKPVERAWVRPWVIQLLRAFAESTVTGAHLGSTPRLKLDAQENVAKVLRSVTHDGATQGAIGGVLATGGPRALIDFADELLRRQLAAPPSSHGPDAQP